MTLRDSGLVGDLGRTIDPDDLEQKSPGRALARLTELRVLNLSQNDLTGGIPAELGRLRRLRELILYGNDLTGPIPSVLAELPDLVSLHLHVNRLSGSIPEGLLGSSCPGCEEAGRFGILKLASNELTGSPPDDIGRKDVSTIDVRSNPRLSGPIPGSYILLGHVDFFGFMFTSICIPPDPDIHVWLARIKSVLAPREADCEPGAAVPTLDPGAVTAPSATSAAPSPGPSVPAATAAYLELLSRVEARRDELAVLEAQAEATGGAERLDRLAGVYAAWASRVELDPRPRGDRTGAAHCAGHPQRGLTPECQGPSAAFAATPRRADRRPEDRLQEPAASAPIRGGFGAPAGAHRSLGRQPRFLYAPMAHACNSRPLDLIRVPITIR